MASEDSGSRLSGLPDLPVTSKARPHHLAVAQACDDCTSMGNPMKVQVSLQVGKGFKLTATVVVPVVVVLSLLAILV
jgi:hypothetical protein